MALPGPPAPTPANQGKKQEPSPAIIDWLNEPDPLYADAWSSQRAITQPRGGSDTAGGDGDQESQGKAEDTNKK